MSDAQPLFGPRQAVTLDGMLEKAGLGGWDWLEKLVDPSGQAGGGELETAAKKIAPLLYGLALTTEGREILEWLCDLTVRRQHFVPGATVEQAGIYAIARGSQDGLVFLILKTIRTGQDLAKGRDEPLRFKRQTTKPKPKLKGPDDAKPDRKTKPAPRAGRRRR